MLGWLFCTPLYAISAIPAYSAPVVDQTGTLTANEIAELSERLLTFSRSADNQNAQIAVLMINSLEGESIEQYAVRVFEQWKIGKKSIDNGVLLIIAKSDRNVRLEVGYGLEGELPDALTQRIIDNLILPAFKRDDYYQGINQAITQLMAYINKSDSMPQAKALTTDADINDILASEFGQTLLGYAAFSFIVCLILSRLSPRFITKLKDEQGLQNLLAGGLNGLSVSIFVLSHGFIFATVLPILFITSVGSTILAAIITNKIRGGGGGHGRGGHYRGGSGGRSGGGFSGGGGGRSGGGGASGRW